MDRKPQRYKPLNIQPIGSYRLVKSIPSQFWLKAYIKSFEHHFNFILIISWCLPLWYIDYYISLESWDFPLSDGIVTTAQFPCIQSLYWFWWNSLLFKYLGHFQSDHHCLSGGYWQLDLFYPIVWSNRPSEGIVSK